METTKIPFYAKASLIFIGLFAFFAVLYVAQSIIVPIIYAIIFAIALSPLVDFFVRKKMNRIMAIALSLFIVLFTTVLIGMILSSQMSVFAQAFPKLLDKFYQTLNNSVAWASKRFNISPVQLNKLIANTKNDLLNGSEAAIGTTVNTMSRLLIVLVLIPVYIFMLLFYRPLLIEFIYRVFGQANRDEVHGVLVSTKTIIQKYLSGLLLEAVIIATLNSVGLLMLGIDYAIIMGVIGAILNVIPFIGGIIAVALPMTIAFVTISSLTYPLLVMGLYIIIQFIDNHYVIPKVVASKVKLNALISIIAVLAFGELWGIQGMFLSIPLTAIVKVICDDIEALRPWGFLLGDTMPTISIFKLKLKKRNTA
jgi:predicted PurR-regulated permease PerM